VVTRPRAQADSLAASLRDLGADVLLAPAFRIASLPSPELEEAIGRAVNDVPNTLIVLTSVNAVRRLSDIFRDAGVDGAQFAAATTAVVGPATASAAEEIGLAPSIVASLHTAEGLADDIESSGLHLGRMRMIHPRARDAAGVIESRLGRAVDAMDAHIVYGTEAEAPAPAFLLPPNVVTFASSSAAVHFERVVSSHDASLIKKDIPVVCIGPATAETAASRGYKRVVTAQTHTAEGLVAAVVKLFSEKGSS
jgi:uroporphyrinogen III methyltransferase/synthase